MRDMEELAKIRYHAPNQPERNIPESGGVYAWYAPFSILGDASARQMVEFYSRLFLWEMDGNEKGEVHAKLAWKRIQLKLKPHEKFDPLEQGPKQEALCDETVKRWLKSAGAFAPPLYIGHTTNLRERYLQHTDPRRARKGNFAGRFCDAAKKLGRNLRVSSLIFAYIETDLSVEENNAIESFAIRAAMPPFADQ